METFLAAGFAAMLLGAALGGAPRFLDGLSLLFVSRLSYSLYLIHLPLIPLGYAVARAVPIGPDPTPLAKFVVFLPIFLCLSVVAALILNYLIEKPFLIIKDRI